MRPGPESPSSQRSLLRGDAYQPAVTPSAGLGPPTPRNPLPTAGPGARGIQRGSSPGGVWLPPPRALGFLSPVRARPELMGEEEESSPPMVGGCTSHTLLVPRHLSEPACSVGHVGTPTEPAAHTTRVPWGLCGGCLVPALSDVSVSLLWVGTWVVRPHEKMGSAQDPSCSDTEAGLELGREPSPSSCAFTQRVQAAVQPVRAQGQQGSPPQGPGSVARAF